MLRWHWRTFWLTTPAIFAAALVLGVFLVVVGMILSFLNWGLPEPVLGRITEFVLGFPFQPKTEPRGNILWSTLALTAAMNIATWATLASLVAGAAITALVGFRRSRPAAT